MGQIIRERTGGITRVRISINAKMCNIFVHWPIFNAPYYSHRDKKEDFYIKSNYSYVGTTTATTTILLGEVPGHVILCIIRYDVLPGLIAWYIIIYIIRYDVIRELTSYHVAEWVMSSKTPHVTCPGFQSRQRFLFFVIISRIWNDLSPDSCGIPIIFILFLCCQIEKWRQVRGKCWNP